MTCDVCVALTRRVCVLFCCLREQNSIKTVVLEPADSMLSSPNMVNMTSPSWWAGLQVLLALFLCGKLFVSSTRLDASTDAYMMFNRTAKLDSSEHVHHHSLQSWYTDFLHVAVSTSVYLQCKLVSAPSSNSCNDSHGLLIRTLPKRTSNLYSLTLKRHIQRHRLET